METSAKNSQNVKLAYELLFNEIHKQNVRINELKGPQEVVTNMRTGKKITVRDDDESKNSFKLNRANADRESKDKCC